MTALKTARENAKMTQAQVAEALGTSQQNYQRWETGKAMPDIDTIRSLARLFRVSLNVLLNREDEGATNFVANHALATGDESGYWGDIGIHLPNAEGIHWHPISQETCSRLEDALADATHDRPINLNTLDNRSILIFPTRANRIILLDEACDEFENPVKRPLAAIEEEGGLPSIVYRGLTAHVVEDFDMLDELGSEFADTIEEMIENGGVEFDVLHDELIKCRIHLTDGTVLSLQPDSASTLAMMGDISCDIGETMLRLYDENRGLQFVPRSNVAMIDIPIQLHVSCLADRFLDSDFADQPSRPTSSTGPKHGV